MDNVIYILKWKICNAINKYIDSRLIEGNLNKLIRSSVRNRMLNEDNKNLVYKELENERIKTFENGKK